MAGMSRMQMPGEIPGRHPILGDLAKMPGMPGQIN